ncbi:MAG TPA: ArsI/CadI family heavy metal resistance metalloenzyme [Candidatus Binatia bacterium]|jgi:catechol 2,3-dioxygenase-like lactoylglutathione lyase family enzyme|nr:ArsI/CadI family heavy metal resistance metalloenzyme [Candidatus Binatia bacterium]
MSTARKVHVALNVTDVNRSVEFYRAVFGLEPVKWKPGYAKFDVAEPPLNLTLNYQGKISDRGALSHLGIEVISTAEVLAAKQRLHKAGLAIVDEMNVDCCFALQDKIWISDPDGYRWEIFTVKVADTQPDLNTTIQQAADSREPQGQRCCSQ